MSIVLPKSMADVEASREFPVAPAGEYELEIKSAKVGKSQQGNTKIDFRCEIINDEDCTGIGVFETITITEAALFRLKQLCLATGVELDDEFDPEVFVGETFSAILNVTSYESKKTGDLIEKNEITKYIFDEE